MKYLAPLLFVEIYLIITLLVFVFGPITYTVESPLLFWVYISLYHGFMVIGYLIGVMPFRETPIRFSYQEPSIASIRFVVFFAFIASLIFHKNLSLSDDLIPFDVFDNLLTGFGRSEELYADRMQRMDSFQGDKLLNVFYFGIAWFRVILIPIVVFYWHKLSFFDRLVAVSVSLLPVISGVATGTNNPIFQFAIFYASSLVLYFMANYFKLGVFDLKSRRFFIFVVIFSLFGAVAFFGFAMQGRGGDVSYLETTSPLGHLKINHDFRNLGDDSFFSYVYVWLSNYVVQGYYGFSQAILHDFSFSYGAGNSPFLQRQFEWATGIDVFPFTYQSKIDSFWGAKAQWHSLYSQLANDISFAGVAIWNLIMGWYMAKLWRSFVVEDDFHSKLLLPLFVLLVIFTPANNQVFGYLETFSAFFIISALRFYKRRSAVLDVFYGGRS